MAADGVAIEKRELKKFKVVSLRTFKDAETNHNLASIYLIKEVGPDDNDSMVSDKSLE